MSWYRRLNARRLLVGSVMLLSGALPLFALVVGSMLAPTPTTVACFKGTPARGGGLETHLGVDPRIKSMVFNFQVTEISGGAVRWSVEDPAGHSRWSGREAVPGAFLGEVLPGVSG